MKEEIIKLLKQSDLLKEFNDDDLIKLIETPPSPDLGDFAFPCFSISKIFKIPPNEIAIKIRAKITNVPKEISSVQTSGAYINFFLNKKILSGEVLREIMSKKENYGKSLIGKGKTVVIEFSSPNIAKPFGIGHLRSTIIGNSLSNIHEFNGFKVIKLNYLGDWGTQFGKLLLGYKKFGNPKKLQKNPIKHLFEIYVKANNKKYENEARNWFKKLEEGDKESTKLWENFKKLNIDDFNKIYAQLGIKFNVISGESLYNKKTSEIVENFFKKGIIKESQGALIVNLEEFGLGICIIQKSDGTTIYAARDIAAAIDRYKKFKFSKMIYEVGNEQSLHFKQVFKVLELMGYEFAKDLIHVDHGLYLSKSGKKFSTRKGKTVFMEEIIEETKKFAEKEIKKRYKLNKKQLEERALKIAIASIFYGDLKNNRSMNMIFDPKKFVSFEGDTGPYILYSYARASSILKKSSNKKREFESSMNDKEAELVKKLAQFPTIIQKSYETLSPSHIAIYAYQLSKDFNEFYHDSQVIDSEKELFRLSIVESFRYVLKNCLNLLGINEIEEM